MSKRLLYVCAKCGHREPVPPQRRRSIKSPKAELAMRIEILERLLPHATLAPELKEQLQSLLAELRTVSAQ